MMPILKIVAVTILLSGVGVSRLQQHKRHGRNWNEILVQFKANDWVFEESPSGIYNKGRINATAQDIRSHIGGTRGLWAMYTDASVLLQLADIATKHGSETDDKLLQTLRGVALPIRMCVLIMVGKSVILGPAGAIF
jgi:hypothetical protein